ncbi:MAG: ABC transporter permease [Chloroflexota bacterium]
MAADTAAPSTRGSTQMMFRPVRVVGLLLLAIVFFLTVYPLAMLIVGSFKSQGPGLPGDWTFIGYQKAYTDMSTLYSWGNSLFLSTTVTLISTVIAVTFAFIVARTDVPLRGLIVPVMTLAFVMPQIFFSLAWSMLGNARAGMINQVWRQLFPGGGPLFDVNSWAGMILVMSLATVAFKFLLLLGAFKGLDLALEEASRIAGAGRMQTLLRVDLPVLAPTILGVMMLSFIRGLQATETPLFLGFPAGIYVFSTKMLDYINNYVPSRYPEATALAVTGVIVMVALVLLQWKILGHREFVTITGKGYKPEIWHLGKIKYALSALIVIYVLLALVLPGIQLFLGSFQKIFGVYSWQSFTLENYQKALDSPVVQRAARNTIMIALVGGFVGMIITTAIAYIVTRTTFGGRRALDLAVWAPWTMPGVVLGIGLLWGYISVPGLKELYGTPWLMLIGMIVTVIPVGVRVMSGALAQLSKDLEESARIHGASWMQAFTSIVVKLVMPSFLYGWLVIGVILSGELSVPLVLYAPGNEVLSIAIYGLQQNAQQSVAAAVFSMVLLVAVSALGVTRLIQIIAERMRERAVAPERREIEMQPAAV